MLDDTNVLRQHDVLTDLVLADKEYEQTTCSAQVENKNTGPVEIENVIISGMGGSGLASYVAQIWLEDELKVPLIVRRNYDLPNFVGPKTLVIACSYSGNTEETVSGAKQALERDAHLAVITSGGELLELAREKQLPLVTLPGGFQPRMALIYQLRSIVSLLIDFGLLPENKNDEIANLRDWLKSETEKWGSDVEEEDNYAKQIAKDIVGKTGAFYCGYMSAPAAYKMKICCNETGKNVSFWNQFPEFNHNEMMGWTSQPVEKPFAIYNIVSSFDNPQTLKRFEITNKLLSGKRPQVKTINLAGDSLLAQLLWGSLLADYVNIYLASLNGVNPMDVDLVEELKKEL